jgi:hypothetical protein
MGQVAHVRELLSLVLAEGIKGECMVLSTLYDKLETQLHALETVGVTREKMVACKLMVVV